MDRYTEPNFFIIGAPKAGTTALYEYLRAHPEVFMSPFKEPHFFADDFPDYRPIRTYEQYRRLFHRAEPQHRAVGEASVWYLLSRVAVSRILETNYSARFIVLLRNPVDLVYSLHSEFVYAFGEDEKDFSRAWDLQEARSRGRQLPKHCTEPLHLQYRLVGRLGDQMARLFDTVPRSQVKIILFDDLVASPKKVYEEVLSFIDVRTDGRTHFPLVNENRRHRVEWISEMAMWPPFPINIIKRAVKATLGLQNTRLAVEFYRRNQVQQKRVPLDPHMRARLGRVFEDDIRLLARLIDRDLSHWITENASGQAPGGVAGKGGESA